jgi:hypothetical protein
MTSGYECFSLLPIRSNLDTLPGGNSPRVGHLVGGALGRKPQHLTILMDRIPSVSAQLNVHYHDAIRTTERTRDTLIELPGPTSVVMLPARPTLGNVR